MMRMKQWVAFVLVCLLLLPLAACQNQVPSDPSQQTSSQEGQPSVGDVKGPEGGEPDQEAYINAYLELQPFNMDPARSADGNGVGLIYNTLEPLVRIGDQADGTAVVMPAAAERWEVSDDGLTYTFHLRKMVWTDGKPLTSAHFAYAIRRGADPDIAGPYASYFSPIENGEAVLAGQKSPDTLGVETPDDQTLVIHLSESLPFFLQIVSQRCYFPQRPDLVEQYGEKYATSPETSPACGPFVLDHWTVNQEMVLLKNKQYWDAEHVRLERIQVKILQDASVIYNALEEGEIDMATVHDAKRREAFLEDSNFYMLEGQDHGVSFLMGNNRTGGISSNVKVRQAVSVALNRDQLAETEMGDPMAAYSLVPSVVSCGDLAFNRKGEGPLRALIDQVKDPKALFEEGLKELKIDPSQAVIHLLNSGDTNDVKTEAALMAEQIEKTLGCRVEVENMDWDHFFERAKEGDFDFAWLSYTSQYNDPSDFMNLWLSDQNIFKLEWKNETYDKLVKSCETEKDSAKRAEAFHQAEKLLIQDEALISPLMTGLAKYFVRSYVRGVSVNPWNTRGFLDVYTTGRK